MSILIKRYANRKLYNTKSSRYITLKGIAELLDDGEEVRVIDNETGDDITSIALSQILVDSKRSNSPPPSSLLSQIMERGGDALYDVLKKGVDDASDNFDEIQDRFRRIIIGGDKSQGRRSSDAGSESPQETGARPERRGLGDWIAYASPDLDAAIQNAVERVFKILDLPRRKDVEALNQNLERVARAVSDLEKAFANPPSQDPANDAQRADSTNPEL